MAHFTIPNCRMGYPHLFEPKQIVENGVAKGEPRFSVNLHLPDDSKMIQFIQNEIFRVWKEKWPNPDKRPPLVVNPADPMTWFNKNKRTGLRSSGIRVPLVWGPAEDPDDQHMEDTWVLVCSAKADSPPKVLNHLKQPVQDKTLVYGGAECYANVAIYGYPGSGTPGISCGINGVMLTGRDVGRFDSKPTMEQMFGDVNLPPPAAESFGDDPFGV